ncbi:hypothetical protein, partial [Holospora undulata]|uniref:hypothetical protein n=1 Tax=Holospora undulata TaxID=1169117 RepID=UPI000552FB01
MKNKILLNSIFGFFRNFFSESTGILFGLLLGNFGNLFSNNRALISYKKKLQEVELEAIERKKLYFDSFKRIKLFDKKKDFFDLSFSNSNKFDLDPLKNFTNSSFFHLISDENLKSKALFLFPLKFLIDMKSTTSKKHIRAFEKLLSDCDPFQIFNFFRFSQIREVAPRIFTFSDFGLPIQWGVFMITGAHVILDVQASNAFTRGGGGRLSNPVDNPNPAPANPVANPNAALANPLPANQVANPNPAPADPVANPNAVLANPLPANPVANPNAVLANPLPANPVANPNAVLANPLPADQVDNPNP